MKKRLSYIIPVLICAVVITVIFVGYFKYEYKANMAHGIASPIGVSLCFFSFCFAELACIYVKKFNAAIVVAIIKFILLFIGLTTVFSHTLAGLGLMAVFALAIPVFLPVALAAIAMRTLVFVALIAFYVGIIAEPVIIALGRNSDKADKSNAV